MNRWRAKAGVGPPSVRAADDGDDSFWVEDWMIGNPSATARTLN